MRGAIVHGVLLVAMLLFAYQTWTRDKSVKTTTGSVVVWNEKADSLQAIVHETKDRTVKVEKKDGYFWGSDTKSTKKARPKDPAAPPDAPPEFDTTTTTREFPVGDALEPLVAGLSAMRAIRDLGPLDDEQKKEYELAESEKSLTVVFAGGPRTLVLGDRVLGGKDRYVLDVGSGRGYVIAGSLVEPLEGGERSLVPKQFIPTGEEVAAIEITAGDKKKAVSRITVTEDGGKTVKTWGDAASKKPDQTTANFLTKVETSLKPTKFEPSVDVKAMTKLVTVTYKDARGKSLGTLELFKRETPAEPPPAPPAGQAGQPPPPPPTPTVEYFIVSDLTRVPGQVNKTAGDQVEQNIGTVFE